MINKKLKIKNSSALLEEIRNVLKSMSFGSVEIYVQDNKVTQLTVRNIVKTKYDINEDDNLKISRKTLKDTLAKNGINVNTIQITQNQVRLGQNRVLTKDNR